ncbi:7TM-DISM domain-containing protein [uncultured Ramlibacter sp.]|uniref:7TM-DISM domain-containing protein n=1 Tax=uncultured Ramlibacter sp. TaxID=260755 RepID=UPI0026127792|nr:7TM-DISM domain-containing protein [uncultured Ramlibacter sp.]
MAALDLVIWSMVLGSIAALALVRLAGLALRPSPSQWQGVIYHVVIFLFVLVLSGVLRALWPDISPGWLRALQVLAGPLSAGLSSYWVRSWLSASQRDRLMSSLLRANSVLLPVLGVACLVLPRDQQLPAAAAMSLFGACLALWLTVRAWLMGDPLAPAMAAGRLLVLGAIGGLYAIAMGLPAIGSGLNAAIAACSALGNGLIGYALWHRDAHEWRTRREDAPPSQFDPVTRLHSGISLVRKLIKAQRRRRRTRRDGAVIAVLVFDIDIIAAQAGTVGVNELFICIASRMQRQVGVVNPVGRYYDRCFVSLVETIHSPAWLRTLGLRVASSLRRPIEISTQDGQRIEVRADIGVGVVHLERSQAPVEDILHDAQRMAQAARSMRSRAAMLDPATGEVVAVEHANLGPRRHRHGATALQSLPPTRPMAARR